MFGRSTGGRCPPIFCSRDALFILRGMQHPYCPIFDLKSLLLAMSSKFAPQCADLVGPHQIIRHHYSSERVIDGAHVQVVVAHIPGDAPTWIVDPKGVYLAFVKADSKNYARFRENACGPNDYVLLNDFPARIRQFLFEKVCSVPCILYFSVHVDVMLFCTLSFLRLRKPLHPCCHAYCCFLF